MQQEDQWISTSSAAALARTGAAQISNLARDGKIVARKAGRRWEISLASLNEYIQRRAEAGATWGWPGDAGKSYEGLSAETLGGYATRNAAIKEAARLHVAAGRGAWVFLGFGGGGWTEWRAPKVM